MRFSDLVGVSERPDRPEPAIRRPVRASAPVPTLSDDPVNNGFVSGLVDSRRGRRLHADRRAFLRSTLTAAAATTAATMANLFGPAKRVAAQTGVIGQYPQRILTYCPPYNANDNCQPGCGSSPICTDCCGSDGFFRNDPANGYSLYPGGCGDGDIADGWIWRYEGVCGNCSVIEYRCSDGYVQTDTGPAPFICRVVTDCVPLPEGAEPGDGPPDAAVATNWRPAGRLEQAVDNGGSVTLTGWIADATGQPIQMRITANGQIVTVGRAMLARPDIAGSVRGAGPNTGFSANIPLDPGEYRFCVDALNGASVSTIGCVNLAVGSGQAVQGPGGTSTITGAPAQPTPTPDPNAPTPEPATPTPEPSPAPDLGPIVVPEPGSATDTDHVAYGAAQLIRRRGATEGFASGWAGDPDSADPTIVEVLVDGSSAGLARTELPRPDVAAAFDELGENCGFALSFELPETQTTVCIDAIDPVDGRRTSLGCRTLGASIDDTEAAEADDAVGAEAVRPTVSGAPAPGADTIWGAIDTVVAEGDELVVTGWAHSPNDPHRTLAVTLRASGTSIDGTASTPHPTVRDLFGIESPCGFELRLTPGQGEHVVELRVGATSLDSFTANVP